MPGMTATTQRTMSAGGVRVEPLPEVAGRSPLDVAGSLRDLPGLTLFESARPGHRARWSYLMLDPLEVLEAPSSGVDPFASARLALGRFARGPVPVHGPPFAGGLGGYLSYDLGRRLERLPVLAADDGALPELRLGLYDTVVAWDMRTGGTWICSRVVDDDGARTDRRRRDLVARLAPAAVGPAVEAEAEPPARFRSNLGRQAFEAMVESVRDHIAAGELYQANVARRLEAAFSGDPWPVYRRLRTGDPVPFAAFLDLGEWRALLSASPEPFLTVDAAGNVASDPIKGTRPRGATPEEDRRLAAELLGSEKDRAENTMIVDVLRNDLGRVCSPGSIRVPRLCRLERTAAVQHLVSTVTGRLEPGRDPWHLLAAAFPGGSITGAPKIRAMQLIETLEPVRRGPYTGAALWVGPDGAMGSSILIRTLVADGRRLTLHVGGGMTWRSDPREEWEETRAKARGPLRAIGAVEDDDGSVSAGVHL